VTIEYILLLVAIFGVSLKFFIGAPRDAFQKSGPRLAARVEKHIATGTGFVAGDKGAFKWEPEK
jgi:hypothetical protein